MFDGNPYGNFYTTAATTNTFTYPYQQQIGSAPYTFEIVNQPLPVMTEEEMEADESPLEWLDRRVEEITELLAA